MSYIDIKIADFECFKSALSKQMLEVLPDNGSRGPTRIDVCLSMVPVEFQIIKGRQKFSFLEDFGFFFGYQISAFTRSRQSGEPVEVLSYSGGRVLLSPNCIEFGSKDEVQVTMTGSDLETYFSKLDALISEVEEYLKQMQWISDDLASFRDQLSDFQNHT